MAVTSVADLLRRSRVNLRTAVLSTNPMKETPLAEGRYIALLKKITVKAIGKVGETQAPAYQAMATVICNDDNSDQTVFGTPVNAIWIIRDGEKDTAQAAMERFVQFLQDSIDIDTANMAIDPDQFLAEIQQISEGLVDEPCLCYVAVTMGKTQKNVNFRSIVPQEELDALGLSVDDVVAQVAGGEPAGEGQGEEQGGTEGEGGEGGEESPADDAEPEAEVEGEPEADAEPEEEVAPTPPTRAPARPAAKASAAKASTPIQRPGVKASAAKASAPVQRPTAKASAAKASAAKASTGFARRRP